MEKTRGQRIRKQIGIAAIPVGILGGIVALIVFSVVSSRSQPVVDPNAGRPVERPLRYTTPRFTSNSSGMLDVAVEVQNPNSMSGAESFMYTLQFQNSAGVIVHTVEEEGFLLPGETRFFTTLGVDFEGVASVSAVSVAGGDVVWRDLPDFTGITLTTKNKQYVAASGTAGAVVSGAVVNSTDLDFGSVAVSVVLFDADDRLLGVNETTIDDVRAGTERSFQTTWFADDIVGDVAALQVDVATDVFDPDNLLRNGSSSGVGDTLNTLDIGTNDAIR